jgi:hypothetical protein
MDLCCIAVVANSFWRMGEYQLRGLGVQHLSAMSKQLVACDGLLEWVHGLATFRSQCNG